MPRSLPAAEVVRKLLDESFDLHAPVWLLRWPEAEAAAERLWELPDGLSIMGGAPRRFGLRLRRHSADGYAVRLLWDRAVMEWQAASRLDLLGSCLAPLLAAIGLDLWSLLEQPLPRTRAERRAA